MDTTEQRVKMCERAEEIQALWKPTIGDWVMVKEEVKWDGYTRCVDAGEVTVVLGIDERGYSGNPIVGDVDDVAFYPECSWKAFNDTPKENLIWLPHQDQLQEMMKEAKFLLSDGEWAYRFGQWCFPQFPNIVKVSMEQLWLAFVMKEKYQKTWNGEDWVKEEL